VCGRPNVGMGNVRVSDSSSPHHDADTLARACGLAQTRAIRVVYTRGTVAERRTSRGALDVATESLLIIIIANAYRKLQDSGCRFSCSAKAANWIFFRGARNRIPSVRAYAYSRPGDLSASAVRLCSSEEVAQDWPGAHSKSAVQKREAWSLRSLSAPS
jgi:hypothetical protein